MVASEKRDPGGPRDDGLFDAEGTRKHFDQHADAYNIRGRLPLQERIWKARRAVFSRFWTDHDLPLRLLDAGGGSGFWADRMLDLFPRAEVTVVDISSALLEQNAHHPRKKLVCSDLYDFFAGRGDHKLDARGFDCINFDVLLHHILTKTSFSKSRQMQAGLLREASRRLAPGGVISIRELLYESLPLLPHQSPQWVLWFASTLQLPARMSALVRRIGIRSQGAGVCYFDESGLRSTLREGGLAAVEWEKRRVFSWDWRFHASLAKQVQDIYVLAAPA